MRISKKAVIICGNPNIGRVFAGEYFGGASFLPSADAASEPDRVDSLSGGGLLCLACTFLKFAAHVHHRCRRGAFLFCGFDF